MRTALFAVVVLTGGAVALPDARAQAHPARSVFINRVSIPEETLQSLAALYRADIPDGRYWYDRVSGAWGMEGGPTLGFTAAGLSLGGPLPADASGRGTGVFINGRELHVLDVLALQRLTGPIAPGRYWLDPAGNAGFEGGPAIANLRVLAAQAGTYRQGSGVGQNYDGGGGAYGNLNTGIGIITDGQGGGAVFSH
jgi:hypothetical protein